MLKKGVAFLLAVLLCCTVLVSISAWAENGQVDAKNAAVTSCWVGNCGHLSRYLTKSTVSVSTNLNAYYYLGLIANPYTTTTITAGHTKTAGFTFSVAPGVTVKAAEVKANFAWSSTNSYSITVGQSIYNASPTVTKYVHGQFQYDAKSATFTEKLRTYDPSWDLFGWNNYCQYSTASGLVKARNYTGVGLSLRTDKRYDSLSL